MKKIVKKKRERDRDSVTSGKITNSPTNMFLEYQRRREEEIEGRKFIWRNNVWNISKFGENYKLTDLRCSINPTQDEFKNKNIPGTLWPNL